jgi:diguanylate cyclase (GGDEF)-like protein
MPSRLRILAAGLEGFVGEDVELVEPGARGRVDAAVVDDIDGWLRAGPHDLPVVIVTDEPGRARAALDAGAQEWLRRDELSSERLRRSIERARLRFGIDQERRRLLSELSVANRELEAVAQHDPLTGLLNRRGLEQALEREAERARRSSTRLAAVMVDCDDFKRINDALGHVIGDKVLFEIGQAMTRAVRPTDYVARLGGDEFLVLLSEVRAEEAGGIAERVRQSISRAELIVDNAHVSVTCSVGWAWLGDERPSVERVVMIASEALRRSKALGKDLVTATDAPIDTEPPPSSVARMLRNLITALQAGERLQVICQPIVELDGRVARAFELTTRGVDGRFAAPEDFFQLAVENGRAASVDMGCLQAVVRVWREVDRRLAGRAHVNVFPLTLAELGIEPVVSQLEQLRAAGVPSFCVELSERRMVGAPTHLKDTVTALREAGIQIALDEVGLSRGALEALVLLRPEFAKIDRRIVDGCADDAAKLRALRRLTEILASLGIVPIAVGVESEDDLAMLRALGIRHGQGFLLGEPQPIDWHGV